MVALTKEGINTGIIEKKEDIKIEESDFSPILLNKAKNMSDVYEVFFCLENAVRELIEERLSERKGQNWWENCVPDKIQKSAKTLREKEEKNKYHVQRSSTLIGYTMFGNLAQIIISNWDNFSDLFPDQHWVSSRFNDLELSRNIIMHTGILPEIEVGRIKSITRDWIRQVG
ncbi:MAG: Swt1 family HEPN domain-containing protein [Candidatus Thorarchaeota archaeon]